MGRMNCTLSRGDTLLLFTDGSGRKRATMMKKHLAKIGFCNSHASLANESANAIQSALLQAVSHHCGGQFQDDATLIVLQRNRN